MTHHRKVEPIVLHCRHAYIWLESPIEKYMPVTYLTFTFEFLYVLGMHNMHAYIRLEKKFYAVSIGSDIYVTTRCWHWPQKLFRWSRLAQHLPS